MVSQSMTKFTRRICIIVSAVCFSFSVFLGASTLSAFAHAFGKQFSCRLIFAGENSSYEKEFLVIHDPAASHGGEPQQFTYLKHTFVVLSDAKWMGLNWRYGDAVLAESVFTQSLDSKDSRVLLVFNPNNTEEQVSLSCSPRLI